MGISINLTEGAQVPSLEIPEYWGVFQENKLKQIFKGSPKDSFFPGMKFHKIDTELAPYANLNYILNDKEEVLPPNLPYFSSQIVQTVSLWLHEAYEEQNIVLSSGISLTPEEIGDLRDFLADISLTGQENAALALGDKGIVYKDTALEALASYVSSRTKAAQAFQSFQREMLTASQTAKTWEEVILKANSLLGKLSSNYISWVNAYVINQGIYIAGDSSLLNEEK